MEFSVIAVKTFRALAFYQVCTPNKATVKHFNLEIIEILVLPVRHFCFFFLRATNARLLQVILSAGSGTAFICITVVR